MGELLLPCQAQRVIVYGASGKSLVGFHVFINQLNAGPDVITDNNKLGDIVDTLESREALQKDLDKLKKWQSPTT